MLNAKKYELTTREWFTILILNEAHDTPLWGHLGQEKTHTYHWHSCCWLILKDEKYICGCTWGVPKTTLKYLPMPHKMLAGYEYWVFAWPGKRFGRMKTNRGRYLPGSFVRGSGCGRHSTAIPCLHLKTVWAPQNQLLDSDPRLTVRFERHFTKR